jgi:hypothetical protein
MSKPQLDYAQKPPLHQRRSWRTGIALVVISSLIFSAYFILPTAWRRARMMYWQNRCLHYQAASTVCVLKCDPDKIPNSWTIGDMNSPWSRFADSISANVAATQFDDTVFVHEMVRPDGAHRLVHIFPRNRMTTLYRETPFFLTGEAYEPGSWGNDPRYISRTTRLFLLPNNPFPVQFKIYSGQFDPANPSHLTIDYEVQGARHTIDGWLDNNDNLLLAKRP